MNIEKPVAAKRKVRTLENPNIGKTVNNATKPENPWKKAIPKFDFKSRLKNGSQDTKITAMQ